MLPPAAFETKYTNWRYSQKKIYPKSGPWTKTTICTVYRVRLRWRNQIKRNEPLAFQPHWNAQCFPFSNTLNSRGQHWVLRLYLIGFLSSPKRKNKNRNSRRRCPQSFLKVQPSISMSPSKVQPHITKPGKRIEFPFLLREKLRVARILGWYLDF